MDDFYKEPRYPSPDRSGYPTAGLEGWSMDGFGGGVRWEGWREEYERRAG